jgi:hypothetical protein
MRSSSPGIIIPIAISALLTLSCTHKVSKFHPEFIPKKFETTLALKPSGSQTLNILYLGCGNLVLEKDGEAIMTDPFFSNQKVLKLLGRIKTNPERYAEWMQLVDAHVSTKAVRSMLISHTHYDHLMDLPTLLQGHVFPNLKAIYGNPYMPKMLQHFKDSTAKFVVLQPAQVYNPNEQNDPEYQWINLAPHVRCLPIESNHAPHIGHKLYMNKPLDEKHFRSNLVWAADKVKAFKWTAGSVYSFLVDFIGSDTLRVFIQTSASEHPNGLPPLAELKKKKVDVALICYASAPLVDDYPGDLLNYITPDKVIFVHWEDFFRTPKSPNDVRLVRGTKPKKVKKRLEAIKLTKAQLKARDYYTMPKPGTYIHIKY